MVGKDRILKIEINKGKPKVYERMRDEEEKKRNRNAYTFYARIVLPIIVGLVLFKYYRHFLSIIRLSRYYLFDNKRF